MREHVHRRHVHKKHNAPRPVDPTPATKEDIDLFIADLKEQGAATLTVRIAGLPTGFVYGGKVQRLSECEHRLDGLQFVPYDTAAYSQPPIEPVLTIDLRLEEVGAFDVKPFGCCNTALCWGSSAGSMELVVFAEGDDGV